MREAAPQCKSPSHPTPNRDTMLLVDETPTHYVFACRECRDINRTLSVQVRTKPAYRQHVREQPEMVAYKRAAVVRKQLGKITYFR